MRNIISNLFFPSITASHLLAVTFIRFQTQTTSMFRQIFPCRGFHMQIKFRELNPKLAYRETTMAMLHFHVTGKIWQKKSNDVSRWETYACITIFTFLDNILTICITFYSGVMTGWQSRSYDAIGPIWTEITRPIVHLAGTLISMIYTCMLSHTFNIIVMLEIL